MRKKISLFITALFMFVLLLIYSIPAHAAIMEHGNKSKITSLDSFNIIECTIDDMSYLEELSTTIGGIIDTGYLSISMRGTFDSREYLLIEEQEYENGKLVDLNYEFDGVCFYEASIDSSYNVNIISDGEYNIAMDYNEYEEVFHKLDMAYQMSINDETIIDDSIYNTIKDYAFYFVYGMTYTYNPSYIHNDLHVVMSYLNKKTMDEILDNVSIVDKTETNYEILDNTYNYDTAAIGQYSFIIAVWDDYQNITVQKVFVDVVDLTAPKIEQIKTTTFSYKQTLTENDILECFSIDDSDAIIEINMSEYLSHAGVIGEYNATITATDTSEYHNSSSLDFVIKIEDTIAPVLAMPSGIHLDYNTYRTEEEIKALFSSDDEYDGNVTASIQITDLDGYKDNYDTLGTYRFNVMAMDNSKNEVNATFYIYVEDHTAPVLTIDKYVIITERYRPITKEQIVALFNDLGYNLDGSNVSSECFSLDSLDGEYDLELSLNDGTIEYDIITTEKNIPISFDSPKDTKKNINLALILSLSIGGFLLSVILVMGVIVYKKRH